MNILLIGSGGREHAIAWSLRKNQDVDTIWALPGNAGIAELATCVPIDAKDLEGIIRFAKSHPVDFAIVAPDDPLAMGLVDKLIELKIPSFGPTAKAARIESSKAFAKDLMKRYAIPTASFEVFTDYDMAIEYLKSQDFPLVIKADGLALGKGVVIATSLEEGKTALQSMMLERSFGSSGSTVVIEEFLTGPEVSVLAFTDGRSIAPMVSSMDHKRIYDGDEGPNTGGMGTIAPNPFYTKEIAQRCMQEIFLPTIKAMKQEGCPFCGCLYFGLMLTPRGPKVIEYNCRFGDPETQVVLPLLSSDLLAIMMDVAKGTLDPDSVCFKDESACCVILASGGYPQSYETGKRITTTQEADAIMFHAGTRLDESGTLVTSGGRVLGVTAVSTSLKEAQDKAYEAVRTIQFDNMTYRSDIGAQALKELK